MNKEKRLITAICLSLTFMVIEIVGGVWSNSLAVLSDAAHLLTDIAGFGIALLAVYMARQPASKEYTFGLARAEVLGALTSIITLWILTAGLVYEAYRRALAWFEGKETPVQGGLMFIIAVFGVVVNICLSCVFTEEHGGAFHSHDHGHGGHGHDHAHSHSHSEGSSQSQGDIEMNQHSHDSCSGHDHDHEHHDHNRDHHDHDHDHHDHGHEHCHSADENSKLLGKSEGNYGSLSPDHDHDRPADEHHHIISGHESHVIPSDVNIQAAYLHVITDLIQSVGVAIAGAIIYFYPQYSIIDPICTFIFCLLIIWSTFSLMNRILTILFEGVPAHVDWEKVLNKLKAIPGVKDVHDLHIWSISSNTVSLTCHILAENPQKALVAAHKVCAQFNIHHATIQVQDCYSDELVDCHSIGCTMANPTHTCMQ